MRVSALLLVLFLAGIASAEKVKTNQETKLFARPGEKGKVLIMVGSGKAMTVLAKEGRWLKVRVQGRTGYVARSTVDEPDDEEMNRNTRRRSFVDGRGTNRGFGGQEGPDDRIGADAVGEGREDEPEPKKVATKNSKDDDEDEDEDEPKTTKGGKPAKDTKTPAKDTKVATKDTKTAKDTKTPAKDTKVATKTPAKGSDEDEDEDEENPVAAKGGKTPAKDTKTPAKDTKVAVKAPAKGSDDDEDEDDEDADRKRVTVSGKATMYEGPDQKSKAVMQATKETALYPTGSTKGKFTEVENDEGDLGYVLTASLQGGGKAAAAPTKVASKKDSDSDDDRDDEEERPSAGKKSSQIDIRLRGGVSFLTQGLRSPGGVNTAPDNYNISTAAFTVALGAGYYKSSGKMVFGGEVDYDLAKATPGVKVLMGKTTSITLHNLNIRAVLGLDFHKKSGMMLLGRAGLKYASWQVANVGSMTENTAKLPSEIIYAPMIGAALVLPRLTQKVGLRFSLDVMPATLSFKQTKNLEDGKSPAAKGAVFGAGFTYNWKKSLDIQATYDLTYNSATFGDKVDTSMRLHPMGGVKRTDTFHAITAGIVYAF